MDVNEALAAAPYPGRGLVVSGTDEGPAIAYWLSGRSAASRNRELVAARDSLLAADIAGDTSDPLRHYRAAVTTDGLIVVGNGDHVDDLAERVEDGASLFDALACQEPEPDPPLRTARLAAMIERATGSLTVGAVRAVGDVGADCIAVATARLQVGSGLLITTYRGEPERPVTWAIPTWIETSSTREALHEDVWAALDERFRVSLASRCLNGGEWTVTSAPPD